MNFTENFYKEIHDRLPESVHNFWGLHNFYHFAMDTDLKQFLKTSIDAAFEKTDANKLSDNIQKLRQAYRKKKKDWAKKFEDGLVLSYSDTEHPLYTEYITLKNMPPAELVSQYKDMSVDAVMSKITAKKSCEIETKRKK